MAGAVEQMDQIRFGCVGCGAALAVRAELAGRKIRCPKCGAAVDVPAVPRQTGTPAGTAVGGAAQPGPLPVQPPPSAASSGTLGAAYAAKAVVRCRCGGCGAALAVRAELAGRNIRCPKCGAVVDVPIAGRPHETAVSPPASQIKPGEEELQLQPLEGGEGQGAEGGSLLKQCPSCAKHVPGTAKACVNCGYSFVLGTQVSGLARRGLPLWRRILSTALPAGALLALIGGFGYLVYDALYSKNIVKYLTGGEEDGNGGREAAGGVGRDAAGNKDRGPGAGKSAMEAEAPNSCLVLEQSRFDLVMLEWKPAAGEPARTEVPRGARREIVVPKGKGRFILSAVSSAAPEVARAFTERYSKGVEFSLGGAMGLYILVEPPPKILRAGDVISGISPDAVKFDQAKGIAEIERISVGEHILSGTCGARLKLAYTMDGLNVKFTWIDQECRVEKGGRTASDPASHPAKIFMTTLDWEAGRPKWTKGMELTSGLTPPAPPDGQ
ncbi:MAG: hypothetical protein N3A38_01575 [Planctomycetota bacterium]|nr:hypothetical protein [Planctomycetota bacterium]